MPAVPALLDRIRTLVDEPTERGSGAGLRELEHTLTDGYAHALALEGERWRIERRIAELSRSADEAAEARELRGLGVRLAAAEDELTRLRPLLRRLRDRADAVRAVAAQAR